MHLENQDMAHRVLQTYWNNNKMSDISWKCSGWSRMLLSSTVSSRRLSLFAHTGQINETANANSSVRATTRELEKTQETTAYHLVMQHRWLFITKCKINNNSDCLAISAIATKWHLRSMAMYIQLEWWPHRPPWTTLWLKKPDPCYIFN